MSGRISSRKNIIVSTHDYVAPLRGGGGLRTVKVAFEFRARGHNVVMIAPTEGISQISGIKVEWLHPPRKQRSQILSALKFNLRLLRKLFKFIQNTDIIFVHNTIAALTIPFLKKVFHFHFFLDITDIHAEYLKIGRRNIFEKMLTPYLLKYEYYIINSADFITVATKAMRELLLLKGLDRNKIEVVYDGVDRENVPQDKEEGSESGVIHIGAVDRQHGVELLIQAIPFIIKDYPHTIFYFIGGGRELIAMKKLAEQLGIIEHCVFTGWLACEESRKFLKKASIGIIPRKDILPNKIITTLKVYEYWASKTAVISSPLDGLKEIASHNENILWFRSGDPKDLAKKITFLLNNKEYKERLIVRGLTTVNHFDIKSSAARITDIVLRCVRRGVPIESTKKAGFADEGICCFDSCELL